MRKCTFLKMGFLLALLFLVPSTLQAGGAANKKLGLGINLGEPLGFSTRFFFLNRFSGDLVIGYGFGEKAFIIQPSLLFHLRGILDHDGNNWSLVPYFGAGFKTGVDVAGANDGEGVVALRFPIGASAFLRQGTFEVSLEFAPGVEFNPQTRFDPTGGIGLRYYFF